MERDSIHKSNYVFIYIIKIQFLSIKIYKLILDFIYLHKLFL
jgi:hypothetical protein